MPNVGYCTTFLRVNFTKDINQGRKSLFKVKKKKCQVQASNVFQKSVHQIVHFNIYSKTNLDIATKKNNVKMNLLCFVAYVKL